MMGGTIVIRSDRYLVRIGRMARPVIVTAPSAPQSGYSHQPTVAHAAPAAVAGEARIGRRLLS